MSTKRHSLMCLLALILLTIVACTAQEPAPVDSELASGNTPSPASGDGVAPTVTAVEALPSPSTTPSPPPATPTRPAASTSNPPAAPAGLEPTATPTATPPTPSPTPTPVPTSSIVPGWLTYENEFLGYSFSYPPEARISTQGVTGFPPEELPKNMTSDKYFEYLKSIYPNDLCVSVNYKGGFLTVFPRHEENGVDRYIGPCGVTGIGDYTIENWEEVVLIDGQPYAASAHRLYTRQTHQWDSEFYLLLDVNGNLRIDFGSFEGTQEEFIEVRETLLRIVESFRF